MLLVNAKNMMSFIAIQEVLVASCQSLVKITELFRDYSLGIAILDSVDFKPSRDSM